MTTTRSFVKTIIHCDGRGCPNEVHCKPYPEAEDMAFVIGRWMRTPAGDDLCPTCQEGR